jgi:N,N'-diacetyllegionaminate synthase
MYTIAEIGQAHEGSLGIAHSYIDALAGSGVDAVKFQIHIADAESSMFEPFRVAFSKQDKTRFDYWKRMEFSEEQWFGLKNHAKQVGLDFVVTPASLTALELAKNIGVDKIKIGSADVNNYLMLNVVSQLKIPVIISSGMSNFNELELALEILASKSYSDISIMQCTTKYPTSFDDWGLNVIAELRKRHALPIGFSDHSGDIYACLAAAALGAEIFEFHVVFDKRLFGPDTSSSIVINDVSKLVNGLNQIHKSINVKIDKSSNSDFADLQKIFGRTLAINKNVTKGHMLQIGDFEAKKPLGFGIPANNYQDIIGKKIARDMKKWEFINNIDLE